MNSKEKPFGRGKYFKIYYNTQQKGSELCSEKFMKEHFKHCSFKKQTHPPDWGETAQQMNFKDKLEVTAKPTQITNTQTTLRCNWGGATELGRL